MTIANMVCIIGRLHDIKSITEDGKEILYLEIITSDDQKNIIPVQAKFLNNEMIKHLEIGSVIGIKGHIEVNKKSIKVICEKISFLSTKAGGDNDEN